MTSYLVFYSIFNNCDNELVIFYTKAKFKAFFFKELYDILLGSTQPP